MTYLISIVVFPAVLVLFCAGFGALALRGAGLRLRYDLLLPAGLAAALAFGYLVAWTQIPYPLNLIVLTAVAIAGLVVLVRERPAFSADGFTLPALSGAICAAFVIAPVVLHGNPTLAGYLLDTTSGIHMSAGDWVLHHGLDFSGTGGANAGDRSLNTFYDANPYPAGGQFLLAVLGALTGTSLLWLYTPFMAMLVAIGAISLFGIARALGLSLWQSTASAVLASVPALAYGYALQGSIKEIAFIPLLAFFAWLLIDRDLTPSPRALAVLGGITSGAAFSAIGFSAVAWVGCFGLALVVAMALAAEPGGRVRAFFVCGSLLALGVIVASVPSLMDIKDSVKLASALSQTNPGLAADPGNLLQPIQKVQSFGTWLGYSHRVDPSKVKPTFIIIGISFALMLAGLIAVARGRRWRAVTWVGISALLWVVLTKRGTVWIDAKLVMLSSAVVVTMVAVGALSLRQTVPGEPRETSSRLISVLALAIVALGIFASDALLYRGYGVLPTQRYQELTAINSEYAGKGPALMPEFDEYAFYVLRDVKVVMPGSSARIGVTSTYRNGAGVPYGQSVDVDTIPVVDRARYPLVVQRAGPWRSNPGPWFKLDQLDTFTEVWTRDPARIHVTELVPLGTDSAYGRLACGRAARMKANAAATGAKVIAGVPAGPVDLLDARAATVDGTWVVAKDPISKKLVIQIGGGGGAEFDATVKPGQLLWWEGRADHDIDVYVDGRKAGSFERMVGPPGNVLAPVALPAGRHRIALRRGGGRFAPGSRNGTSLESLALAPHSPSVKRDVSSLSAKELCTRQLDWVAVVK